MNDATALTRLFLEAARFHLLQQYLPWLRACLAQLPEEDIWWRPNAASNSAGNLLLHLCGNVRQWILHGIAGRPDVRVREAEFAASGPLPKAELLQQLETTLAEVDGVLQHLTAEDLPQPRRIQGFDQTVLRAVFHVVEHFSYHTGQIIYLTKLRTGVDLKFWNL
ncbi:MAG: DUF1572 domain-containing protein [candidate division KSB1 bacterium]|nr:DUF1572 domain-containing protein [candidate division KSB1 bacterium]MDZ7272928.1 DUF1572 domain-containing protein [candidate division KSB1 bacterium]MDZ7284050.1 DUF1572 domain-containing protein [candidate division KSB1 bacterium]MDZ7297553.1 DUF1572 domain-containing protein [candidate division KSB1 bacterium]MDZ7308925.1 DUF1572 domain-containing protein [candidate division KSB1 bacterium]